MQNVRVISAVVVTSAPVAPASRTAGTLSRSASLGRLKIKTKFVQSGQASSSSRLNATHRAIRPALAAVVAFVPAVGERNAAAVLLP
jgi:hypothetical protein